MSSLLSYYSGMLLVCPRERTDILVPRTIFPWKCIVNPLPQSPPPRPSLDILFIFVVLHNDGTQRRKRDDESNCHTTATPTWVTKLATGAITRKCHSAIARRCMINQELMSTSTLSILHCDHRCLDEKRLRRHIEVCVPGPRVSHPSN